MIPEGELEYRIVEVYKLLKHHNDLIAVIEQVMNQMGSEGWDYREHIVDPHNQYNLCLVFRRPKNRK